MIQFPSQTGTLLPSRPIKRLTLQKQELLLSLPTPEVKWAILAKSIVRAVVIGHEAGLYLSQSI